MRRSILVGIPILGVTVIIQSAIIGRIQLLSGAADLVLLVLAAWGLQDRARATWVWAAAAGLLVGAISGIPWFVYLVAYLGVAGMAQLLARRIWQAPLLAMFLVTVVGTLILLLISYAVRIVFDGLLVSFDLAFMQVILPSLLLNLLLSIPVHGLVRSLVIRLYPQQVNA